MELTKTGKYFYFVLFFAFFSPDCYSQTTFVLNGRLSQKFDGATVTVRFADKPSASICAITKQGRFYFTGMLSAPYERVYVTIEYLKKRIGGANFFLHADRMQIDFESLDSSGQLQARYSNIPFAVNWYTYQSLTKSLQDTISLKFNLFKQLQRTNNKKFDLDSLAVAVRNLQTERAHRRVEFIKTNRQNFLGLYIFNQDVVTDMRFSADSLITIFNLFNEAVQQTTLGRLVKETLLKRKSLTVGKTMPSFSFVAADGNRYRSDSLKKKFLLLSFWHSACGPCIAAIPFFKKIYEEYKARGLEFLYISMDDAESKWRSSLKKYDMPWLQTIDLNKYNERNSFRKLFEINRFPQYFIIDESGKLIYHNIQLGDDDSHTILMRVLSPLLL